MRNGERREIWGNRKLKVVKGKKRNYDVREEERIVFESQKRTHNDNVSIINSDNASDNRFDFIID